MGGAPFDSTSHKGVWVRLGAACVVAQSDYVLASTKGCLTEFPSFSLLVPASCNEFHSAFMLLLACQEKGRKESIFEKFYN